jgi:hypothetical protein
MDLADFGNCPECGFETKLIHRRFPAFFNEKSFFLNYFIPAICK